MLEHQFRFVIQPLIDTIARSFPKKITPNVITGIALTTGMFAGYAIGNNHMYMALGMLWFSGICDVLDGTLARIRTISNPVGAYIDLISDRMVESAIIVGCYILYPQYGLACLLFFVALLFHFSTFIAAGALFENSGEKSFHYEHTLIERAEAFVVFSFMLMFPQYMFETLMCFNGLIFISAANRMYRVITFTQEHE